MPRPETSVRLSDEVSSALAEGHPVVALESTIFSRMGLPAPHNQSALAACLDSVRSGGAVPAITAVVDGEARVGLDPDEHGRILEADTKTSRRDLGVAIGARWPVGATTVAASLRLAALAGISVFSTVGAEPRSSWTEPGDVVIPNPSVDPSTRSWVDPDAVPGVLGPPQANPTSHDEPPVAAPSNFAEALRAPQPLSLIHISEPTRPY